MTVTPEQAMKMNEQDHKEVSELERRIDNTLINRFEERSNRIYINVGDTKQKVLNELINRYNSAGWDVKYRSDQKEGNCLEFTAKNNYSGGQR